MAVPTVDTNHVAEGLALLTDHYRNQPVIRGILTAYLNPFQDVENVLWDVINSRLLVNNPTGDVLTQVGKLIGQPRGALSDTDLLAAVKLRILANKSNGCAEDIIGILAAAAPGNNVYWEGYPKAFGAALSGITSPDIVQSILHEARPAAHYGLMVYSTTWAIGSIWGWSGLGTSLGGQWGWSGNSAIGGLLAAGRAT